MRLCSLSRSTVSPLLVLGCVAPFEMESQGFGGSTGSLVGLLHVLRTARPWTERAGLRPGSSGLHGSNGEGGNSGGHGDTKDANDVGKGGTGSDDETNDGNSDDGGDDDSEGDSKWWWQWR